jgi:UDP-glucose 4-epimerase
MSHSLKNLLSSDVYNLGSGVGTSIMQLLNIFQRVVDIPFRYRILEKRPSDNSSIVLDSSKLMKLFSDFRCQKLEEKIPETWNYFKTTFHET